MNIISGNTTNGIELLMSKTDFLEINKIWGNYIGTDLTGNKTLEGDASNQYGIILALNAVSNKIGGRIGYVGNIISGNKYSGIRIRGDWHAPAAKNEIIGNAIGTGRNVTIDLRNNVIGIELLEDSEKT